MLRIVACDSRRATSDAAEIAAEQGDACGFDGDIGPRAHRDPDVGGGQRWGVVDAVAGHGDDPPFLAQPFNDFALVLRQNFRLDFGDAELAPHGLCGRAIVAGEHHDADARVLERANSVGRRRLDRIGDGDHAARLAVERGEDRGRAVAA